MNGAAGKPTACTQESIFKDVYCLVVQNIRMLHRYSADEASLRMVLLKKKKSLKTAVSLQRRLLFSCSEYTSTA